MTFRELRLPLLACTALLALAITARAKVTETFKQTYPLAADGVIHLSTVNGSIEIVAWDKAEVALEAEKSAKNDEELKRISLEIDAQPAKLSIKTKYEKTSVFGNNIRGEVKYKLMVPAGVSLKKIDTVNSNIVVTGVKGAMDISTVNGRITATGALSAGEFETVNGSIHVDYTALPATGEISLDSVNGSATVVVPKDAGFELKADSVNGNVSCSLPITLAKSGRHHLRGRVGSGGATIDLETVNGGLNIETR